MNIDVLACLSTLNDVLKEHHDNLKLTLCGGALVVLEASTQDKQTHDIDFLTPIMNDKLKNYVIIVSKRLGLTEDWLNDSAKAFIESIPKNWEKRLVQYKKYSHLMVYGLCRNDLLASKMKAHIDRGFDASDIIKLAPNKKEFFKAREFVESFGLNKVEIFDLDNLEREVFNV